MSGSQTVLPEGFKLSNLEVRKGGLTHCRFPIADCQFAQGCLNGLLIGNWKSAIGNITVT
jgi:hypothetical protein